CLALFAPALAACGGGAPPPNPPAQSLVVRPLPDDRFEGSVFWEFDASELLAGEDVASYLWRFGGLEVESHTDVLFRGYGREGEYDVGLRATLWDGGVVEAEASFTIDDLPYDYWGAPRARDRDRGRRAPRDAPVVLLGRQRRRALRRVRHRRGGAARRGRERRARRLREGHGDRRAAPGQRRERRHRRRGRRARRHQRRRPARRLRRRRRGGRGGPRDGRRGPRRRPRRPPAHQGRGAQPGRVAPAVGRLDPGLPAGGGLRRGPGPAVVHAARRAARGRLRAPEARGHVGRRRGSRVRDPAPVRG